MHVLHGVPLAGYMCSQRSRFISRTGCSNFLASIPDRKDVVQELRALARSFGVSRVRAHLAKAT